MKNWQRKNIYNVDIFALPISFNVVHSHITVCKSQKFYWVTKTVKASDCLFAAEWGVGGRKAGVMEHSVLSWCGDSGRIEIDYHPNRRLQPPKWLVLGDSGSKARQSQT